MLYTSYFFIHGNFSSHQVLGIVTSLHNYVYIHNYDLECESYSILQLYQMQHFHVV